MEIFKTKFNSLSGGIVLDVGTGRGEFIYMLKDYLGSYSEIIGIDHSEKAVHYCKSHFSDPCIHFEMMNASNLKFPDNTFDTVCISNSLHHLEQLDGILSEMKRVLKPDGNFIINEMISDNQSNEQLSHVKLHHFAAKLDCIKGIYHKDTFTRREIIEKTGVLNLHDIDIFEYAYPHDNAKDMESVNYLLDLCDQIMTGIQKPDEYQAECNEIKDWIQKYGYLPATEVVIIGKK